jgi:hypothetical protein
MGHAALAHIADEPRFQFGVANDRGEEH